MMDVDPTEVPRQSSSHETLYACGSFGLIVGIIGLALAVAHPHIAEASRSPEPPPRKLSEIIAEAGDKFVGRIIVRAKGKKTEPGIVQPASMPRTPWTWYLTIAATTLGFVGAVSGTVGWIRREDHRLAACAIGAGSLAVAWAYILAALTIALVIVFLILLLRYIDV